MGSRLRGNDFYKKRINTIKSTTYPVTRFLNPLSAIRHRFERDYTDKAFEGGGSSLTLDGFSQSFCILKKAATPFDQEAAALLKEPWGVVTGHACVRSS